MSAESGTDAQTKTIKARATTLAIVVVLFLLARGLVFPRVVNESTVAILAGHNINFSYTPDITNRKLVLEVQSTNGVAVNAAIIEASQYPIFSQGRITLAEAAGNVVGAHHPSIIEGSVERYATSGNAWTVVVVAGDREAHVRLKLKSYLRF